MSRSVQLRLFAVIRTRGPAWQSSVSLEAQRAWGDHAEFINALAAEGVVIVGWRTHRMSVGDGRGVRARHREATPRRSMDPPRSSLHPKPRSVDAPTRQLATQVPSSPCWEARSLIFPSAMAQPTKPSVPGGRKRRSKPLRGQMPARNPNKRRGLLLSFSQSRWVSCFFLPQEQRIIGRLGGF
jgi:hypothetical protein